MLDVQHRPQYARGMPGTKTQMRLKARENRLRRAGERRGGYRLVRCRRRDPLAVGYGTYYITDATDRIVAGDPVKFGLTLNDVEMWLKRIPAQDGNCGDLAEDPVVTKAHGEATKRKRSVPA